MQKKMIQAIALALTLASSSAWAKWELVGGKYTDGDFSFTVYNSSNVKGGGKVLQSLTKATTDLRDLDLTSFYDDTGFRIVEIQEGTYVGNIQYVTGFIGPDVVRINNYGLGSNVSGNKYPFVKIHVSADLEYLGNGACGLLHQLVDFYPLDMEKLTYCGSAFDQCSIKGDIRMPILTKLGGNFCRIYNGTAGITSIYAPNVTEVGDGALSKQELLTNAVFSANLTKIGNNAFLSCAELETFAPRQAPMLVSVGNNAFQWCAKLTGSFTLPVCLSVGSNAFGGCAGLQELTVSSDLTSIGGYAFWKCSQFTNFNPHVFNKFTGTVGDYAFGGQDAATATKISGDYDFGGAASVGSYAFAYTSVTSIRCTNVASVAERAFYSCQALTNAVFSQNLKSIDALAFCNCKSLVSFEPFLPAGMTKLAYAAFDSCKILKTPLVWKSPALTTFAGTTFGGCLCLTNVTINSYIKDFTGGAFNNISDGCCFYWNVAAPETITQPIVGGAPNGFRFYIKAGKNDPAWKAWTTDATFGKTFTKQTYGYPGRKTFGLLQDTTYASAVQMWLIDNEPRGIAIIVR